MLEPYDARCFNEKEKRKVVKTVEFFPCSNIINSWQIWVNEVPTSTYKSTKTVKKTLVS